MVRKHSLILFRQLFELLLHHLPVGRERAAMFPLRGKKAKLMLLPLDTASHLVKKRLSLHWSTTRRVRESFVDSVGLVCMCVVCCMCVCGLHIASITLKQLDKQDSQQYFVYRLVSQ